MFVLFYDGFAGRDYHLPVLPDSGNHKLAFCIAADFLYALADDCGIADYIFCNEGVVRVVICPFSVCLTCCHLLDNGYTYHHSDKTEWISYCASHGHIVSLTGILRIYLKECLLGGTEHRSVCHCAREETHKVWKTKAGCPVEYKEH